MMQIAPFSLERFFAEYEFTAPHLLCPSDCETSSTREVLALEPGAADALLDMRLGYTESPGDPALRASIASMFGQTGPDDVLVHTGAEEAIFIFMNTVLDSGNDIVVTTPCYQSLAEVARALGAGVTPLPVREELGWTPDPDELEDCITRATRAVVINFPHNPTGGLPDGAVFQAIVDVCRKHGVLLFSDEVYRFLEIDPADRLPSACDVYENAVSLGVMSKSFGLPGLRIGWAASRNRHVIESMAAFKDYTTICNPAPSEFLARVALDHREVILERNRSIMLENLAALDDFFERNAHAVQWTRPGSGPVGFPRMVWDRHEDADEFCLDVLQKTGVLLAPGAHFGLPGPYFRLGFGRRNMKDALAKFEAYLNT